MRDLLERVTESWRAAAVTVALVPLLPHLPLLLGRVSPVWDALNGFGPYFMLIGDYARHGEFLLWNPFINGGSPDYIEPQLGVFSPLVMLFAFVFGGARLGFDLYWLAVWVLGPLGVLALARHLGAPSWGGVVAALGLAFSGFYTGSAENQPLLATLSFLPWMLWRLDVALRAPSHAAAAEAGALFGLSAMGGYPGLVFLNLSFAGLWALGRVVWSETMSIGPRVSWSASLQRLVAMHAVMLLVGIVVLSPTYVPFFIEGQGYSHRTGALPREIAVTQNPQHPATVVTLTSPAFGRVDMFGNTDISMRSIYVGTLVPLLAVFALAYRRRAFRWWLLAVSVGFLLTAMSSVLPLRAWVYDWVPPTRYFRHATLFRLYFIFGVTLLSVFGARDLGEVMQTESAREWRRFVMITGSIVAVALAVYVATLILLHGRAAAVFGITARAETWATWLVPAVLVAVASALTWQRRVVVLPIVMIAVAIVEALGTAVIVRPLMYGQAAAWQSVPREHRTALMSSGGLMRVPDHGGNFTFVPKTLAMKGYNPLAGPQFDAYSADPVLVASATGENRLWFSTSVTRMDRSNECFEAFRARAAQLGAPPFVLHSPDVMEHPTAFRAGASAASPCAVPLDAAPAAERLDAKSVRVVTYEPLRMTLQVDIPSSGWLLVSDSWSHGWSAAVNGRATLPSGGNFIFRAVPVDAGTNTVDFQFNAFGFPWLVGLSWLTLAVVGTAAIIRSGE
ncbi:MAG: hypothetical protein HY048_07385 [Acidobacteria bacterium]|nr:hypothetical protein [Acidobacteriota bacterium]